MSSEKESAATPPIRVMLVDDHKAILWGLERLLESARPRMQLVASASSAAEMLAAAQATQPDVILLDLDLNGDSSLDALPALLQCCAARVLVFTGDRDPASHQAAILAGARGVLLKDESAETLLQAIEDVAAGEVCFNQKLMGRMIDFLSAQNGGDAGKDKDSRRIAELTAREREIVRAVVSSRGAKSVVIAETLNITEHTLRNHLTAIYDKLGLRNRIDLFAYASEHRLDLDSA